MKTCMLFKLFQIVPNNEKSACLTTFVFKSLNLAQILENFMQTCVCTSASYRNSESLPSEHSHDAWAIMGHYYQGEFDCQTLWLSTASWFG